MTTTFSRARVEVLSNTHLGLEKPELPTLYESLCFADCGSWYNSG